MKRSAKLATAVVLAAVAGCAQSTLEALNPLEGRPNGLHLSNISLFGGYTSVSAPGPDGYLSGAIPVGTNQVTGAELLLRWDRTGPRGGISFSYTPSYIAVPGHSEWSAANHALSFSWNRKVHKWDAGFALNGTTTSSSEMLFSPSVLSKVTALDLTFEDLAAAMLSGRFTNNELASILTGAPLEVSPAQSLIYGSRVMSAGASATVSYSLSSRASFHFSGGLSRFQYFNDRQGPESARNKALVPRNTSGNTNVGLSYSLTPRTNVGVDTSATRIVSAYEDAYALTARLAIGRKMGQRWFLNGYGGSSTTISRDKTAQLPQGAQYVAGGSVGFRMRSQTFVGAVDRTASDTYGLGAGYTLSTTGAWSWRRPGSAWTWSLSGGWQRVGGTSSVSVAGCQVASSLSRAVSRHVSASFSYAHMTSEGGRLGVLQDLTMDAARFSLVWTPSKTP
jgi:hypothetical protein